jgi:hypothetical protein
VCRIGLTISVRERTLGVVPPPVQELASSDPVKRGHRCLPIVARDVYRGSLGGGDRANGGNVYAIECLLEIGVPFLEPKQIPVSAKRRRGGSADGRERISDVRFGDGPVGSAVLAHCLSGEIGQGNDADQPASIVDHRKAPHTRTAHGAFSSRQGIPGIARQ